MSELQLIQEWFQNYLMRNDATIVARIIGTQAVSIETRLGIYANAYKLRIQEILKSDYAILAGLLGDEKFVELAQSYSDSYPSHFRSARWIGRYLPMFLQLRQPYAYEPWLAQTANFEWLFTEVFDAADSPVVTLEDLRNIPMDAWPTMRLIPVDSLRIVDLDWNIVEIWHAYKENLPLPEVQKLPTPSSQLLWRDGYQIKFHELPTYEAWAINAICNYEDFSTLCAGLCEWFSEEEVAMKAASLLKTWVVEKLISKVVSYRSPD